MQEILMIRNHLSFALLKPKYVTIVSVDDPVETGHCYIAAEALFHLLGGKEAGYTAYVMRVDDDTHWFLKDRKGKILDPTAAQFPDGVDYSKGRPCGFLTKKPSRRAQYLIDKVREGGK